jgi:hypothetical protein
MAFSRRSHFLSALCAGTILGVTGGFAAAADLPTEKAPPPPPPSWWSTVTYSGELDAGIMGNPDDPPDGNNFGRLFDNKANDPVLNAALYTITRPTGSTGYDVGFTLQGEFGTDARFTHFLGEGQYWINSPYQFSLLQANILVHTPWITDGGIDWKIGQWPTLEGAEVIDPAGNLFYSHSYIFNYAEPFEDLGILAVTHINPTLDIYAAVTSSQSTTLDYPYGTNNTAPNFEGGFGLNKLFGGAVTVLATTHIGPVNGTGFPGTPGYNNAANNDLSYENDLVVTWNATPKLTLTGDGNYTRNDFIDSETYGFAGYASYQTDVDWLKINGRAEVFRDDGGFVCAFPGNFDYVNSQFGYGNTSYCGAPATYFEITGGLNITPTLPSSIPFVKGIIFRPEVRYDTTLDGVANFNNTAATIPPNTAGARTDMITFGGDVIVKF